MRGQNGNRYTHAEGGPSPCFRREHVLDALYKTHFAALTVRRCRAGRRGGVRAQAASRPANRAGRPFPAGLRRNYGQRMVRGAWTRPARYGCGGPDHRLLLPRPEGYRLRVQPGKCTASRILPRRYACLPACRGAASREVEGGELQAGGKAPPRTPVQERGTLPLVEGMRNYAIFTLDPQGC